ncbi:hypothetical protein EH183_29805 [Streptomyces sp. CB01881]|nr:hypothetical protein C2142_29825 [Streptomyces sp. CB01881]TYC71848.1 hypothetical protein EH183_29805 [Streptomyces sp. CB01881]
MCPGPRIPGLRRPCTPPLHPAPAPRACVPGLRPDFSGRKQRLRFLLSVSGADGHRAVVSWAEIDPEFADRRILLATSMDGAPLDAAGPQLVVPGARCGARYVSVVTAVWLGPLEEPAP